METIKIILYLFICFEGLCIVFSGADIFTLIYFSYKKSKDKKLQENNLIFPAVKIIRKENIGENYTLYCQGYYDAPVNYIRGDFGKLVDRIVIVSKEQFDQCIEGGVIYVAPDRIEEESCGLIVTLKMSETKLTENQFYRQTMALL